MATLLAPELGYIFYHITPAVPWRASRRNELYPRCISSAARSALSAASNNLGNRTSSWSRQRMTRSPFSLGMCRSRPRFMSNSDNHHPTLMD